MAYMVNIRKTAASPERNIHFAITYRVYYNSFEKALLGSKNLLLQP